MNFDIFTLCDSAQEYAGRMIIVGTFNTINVTKLPTVYSEFAIAAKVTIDQEYKKLRSEHTVKFYIKKFDSDLYLLPPFEHKIRTDKTPDFSDLNLVMRFNGIPIKEDGRYIATMEFDSIKKETSLFVRLHKQITTQKR